MSGFTGGFPPGSDGKESACQCRRRGFDPWVGKIPWRRDWQPPPIFLPGEFHGQRSLEGYSPWVSKESDTTEQLTLSNFHPQASQASLVIEKQNSKIIIILQLYFNKFKFLKTLLYTCCCRLSFQGVKVGPYDFFSEIPLSHLCKH